MSAVNCYVDVRVNAYIIGSGPPTLTVLVEWIRYNMNATPELVDEIRRSLESVLVEGGYHHRLRVPEGGIAGREAILFIGPAINISTEVWEVVAEWDVQQRQDNVVIAVHPHRDSWMYYPEYNQRYRTQLEMELPAFTQVATTSHQARVTEYDGRAGRDPDFPLLESNANQLRDYYVAVGAYSATSTFTPALPPPVYMSAPTSLTATTDGEETVDLSWSSVTGASGYEVQYRIDGVDERWYNVVVNAMSTTHTVSDLWCNTTHDFRVGAYGDGTTYNARAGLWSATARTTTAACSPKAPRFRFDSYSFQVDALARVGKSVGRVSAVDLNGDSVLHSITAGNEDARFAIASGTGEISVAKPLGLSTSTSYGLTVGASDGISGTTTVDVSITVAPISCNRGFAALDPAGEREPGLVPDCETLLSLRDTLAGTAILNWDLYTPITSWDGVTVGGTPRRVTRLVLERRGLTGELPTELGLLPGLEELNVSLNSQLTGLIPAELGDLANLHTLHLHYNRLTGPIPPELGGLSKLTDLQLHGNALNGPIPPELGNLSELVNLYLGVNYLTGPIPVELSRLAQLEDLWLSLNRLSGPIPPELGMLQALRNLELDENRLSGGVPWELGSISSLSTLRLSENSLEGCIRSSLRNVQTNDLDRLGLADCPQTARVPAPVGLGVSLASSTFTVTWGR